MSIEYKKEKLRRNIISLDLKISILNRISNGEKVSHIAKNLNLNESTIRTITRNEDKIRKSFAAGSSLSRNRNARAPIMIRMEKELNNWILECNEKTIPISGNAIKQKALEIYNKLKENEEDPSTPEFIASGGWFERFKNRFQIFNVKLDNTDSTNKTFVSKGPKPRFKLLDDMTSEDVEELLIEIEINDANLSEMVTQNDLENISQTENTKEESIVKNNEDITLNSLREGFDLAEKLEFHFLKQDNCTKRKLKFKRELQQCLAPYTQVYKELLNNSEELNEDEDLSIKRQKIT